MNRQAAGICRRHCPRAVSNWRCWTRAPRPCRRCFRGGGEGDEEEGSFDLLKYWHVIVKRKWTVLSVFVIVLLTGVMMTMLTTPMYRATATVQIERQAARVVNVPGMEPIEGIYDFEFYETQFQLLRSRSMAEKVAAGLDPEDPVFEVMGAPSPMSKLMQIVLGFGQSERKIDPEQRRRDLVNLVRNGLTIEPVVKSRLVRIHFDSPEGAMSAAIAECGGHRVHRVEHGAADRQQFLRTRVPRGPAGAGQAQAAGLRAGARGLRAEGHHQHRGSRDGSRTT